MRELAKAKRREPESGGPPPEMEEGTGAVRPLGAALRLSRLLADIDHDVIFVAADERRAEEIAAAARVVARSHTVSLLQPWDCLPYDRVSPSREVMGNRIAALRAFRKRGGGPRLLVTSPEAAMLMVAPPSERMPLKTGAALDRAALESFAVRTGYLVEHTVDDPGDIALQGGAIDVFPAGAIKPIRLMLGEGDVIETIKIYDPADQRTDDTVEAFELLPASEVVLPEGDAREQGIEHRLPAFRDYLAPLFDLLPKAKLCAEPGTLSACRRFRTRVEDAFEARRLLDTGEDHAPTPPGHLYAEVEAIEAALSGSRALRCNLVGLDPVPSFAAKADPSKALADFVREQVGKGRTVVLASPRRERERFRRTLKTLKPRPVDDLADDNGKGVFLLEADFDAGVIDGEAGLVLVAAADVFGSRPADDAGVRTLSGMQQLPQPGDVVVHEDHGVAVLRGLEEVDVEGGSRDMIELEYHDGDILLAPVEEFDRVWRYSSEVDSVSLDRLHTDGWNKRRVKVNAHVEEAAARLVELARERAEAEATPIKPPKKEMAAFVAGFAFSETADQGAAISDVLADLASGRPMNRLVCGDVGFGKTEVALRAAAAVALGGRQVALVAPTTVLARQHAETFARRFAGSGVDVVHLSRFATAAEAKEARRRLASGEAAIVVGTQMVAGDSVEFADLALVIVDEEHRLGAKMKDAVRALAPHHLSLSATPIPRTLQGALVGVQDVSLLAIPPARRRPVRTSLSPLDPVVVKTALLKEKRRGGQSFAVVPRIADVEAVRALLAEQVPNLSVAVAHGDLAPDAIDEAMVRFAAGDTDVLLATSLIESGLDVPRANTMLVWNAELFGLAQLHQLRGRVGRGRAQGVVHLFAPDDEALARTTAERLAALVAADRLGAGFTLSARDLDLRGGGDLVGDEQAGHMRLIGAALYQHLLAGAVRAAQGEEAKDRRPPEIKLVGAATIPPDYVTDEALRVAFYARFAACADEDALDDLRDEMRDRFGDVPPSAVRLLAARRLALLAERAGVSAVTVGPKATALDFVPSDAARARKLADGDAMRWKDNRLILDTAGADSVSAVLERVLGNLVPSSGA